jgi:RHS repeat-associated protein
MLRMPQLQIMQWDFRDQLQMTQRQPVSPDDEDGIRHQSERTHYVYDGNGQRVRKVTERRAAAGQTPTRIMERIYLGGYEVYREYDADGSTVSLERETLHVMDDQQRIALVETRTQGSEPDVPGQLIRYQFSNHLGSASLELDEQAHIISYEEYYPYGSTSYQAVRSGVEANPKRYRYTGLEQDEESGFSYHQTRYYAPWLGRWTSCDAKDAKDSASNTPPTNSYYLSHPRAIGSALGASIPCKWVKHEQNAYLYCGANPVGFVDLNGKDGSAYDHVRLWWFRVQYPHLSWAVGLPEQDSNPNYLTKPTLHPNISTLATRFSNWLPFGDTEKSGTKTNAMRHAIWQGLIIRDFSAKDAELVGNVHEHDPSRDLSVTHFENPKVNGQNDTEEGKRILAEADEVIDLLNNDRARSFYNERLIRDKSNKGIVEYYLGIFRYEGFYVADITYNSAGTAIEKVDISLRRLDPAMYVKAMKSLGEVNEIGLSATHQALGEKAAIEAPEEERQRERWNATRWGQLGDRGDYFGP